MNSPFLSNLLLTTIPGQLMPSQLMPGQPNQQPTIQTTSQPALSLSRDSLEELSRIICNQYPTQSDFFSLIDAIVEKLTPNGSASKTTGFSHQTPSSFPDWRTHPSQEFAKFQTQPSKVFIFLERLNKIPHALEATLAQIFDPRKFRSRPETLTRLQKEFNDVLAYDGWRVFIQQDGSIGLAEAKPDLSAFVEKDDADKSLDHAFATISLDSISHNGELVKTLQSRLRELRKCLDQEVALASIILAGSILEGVLRGIAEDYPRIFNTATTAPKDGSNTRQFRTWSFANFIDVAAEVGFLNTGTRKFNHVLRDFRNYIHPYEQLANHFEPDMTTALLCFQTMRGTILHIQKHLKELSAPPA